MHHMLIYTHNLDPPCCLDSLAFDLFSKVLIKVAFHSGLKTRITNIALIREENVSLIVTGKINFQRDGVC